MSPLFMVSVAGLLLIRLLWTLTRIMIGLTTMVALLA